MIVGNWPREPRDKPRKAVNRVRAPAPGSSGRPAYSRPVDRACQLEASRLTLPLISICRRVHVQPPVELLSTERAHLRAMVDCSGRAKPRSRMYSLSRIVSPSSSAAPMAVGVLPGQQPVASRPTRRLLAQPFRHCPVAAAKQTRRQNAAIEVVRMALIHGLSIGDRTASSGCFRHARRAYMGSQGQSIAMAIWRGSCLLTTVFCCEQPPRPPER
jgi:hypothetical protein